MRLHEPPYSFSIFNEKLLYASCKKVMYVMKSTGPPLVIEYLISKWSPGSKKTGAKSMKTPFKTGFNFTWYAVTLGFILCVK